MNVKTVYPIVTFCNETDQSKDIAISTYAFSYDYPKKIATIKNVSCPDLNTSGDENFH